MTAFGNGDSGSAGSVPAVGGAFGGGASGSNGAIPAFGGDPRRLPARGGGNSLPLDEPVTALAGGPFGIVCGSGIADAGAPFGVLDNLLDNSACRASLFICALRNSLG